VIIEFINRIIGTLVPFSLVISGLYFSIKLRFFWIFHPLKLLRSMFGKRDSGKDSISPFRAVTVALAGTLGVGNIVGVAGAIALGGFGAIFWMWASALCAMVLKYAEITLAVSHRRSGKNGFCGGSLYYISDFFGSKGLTGLGSFTACVFALFLLLDSFTTGSVVQINAASRSMSGVFGISPVIIGISSALITFFVVITGAKGVSKLTGWLIPLLSVAYIVLSLSVMIKKADSLPYAFSAIFKNAFDLNAVGGGIVGFLTSRALRFGTMRGLLSNEAGCGTAPMAHASADAKSPAEQGFWGIFEVFVDTIVLCTLTAVIIILNYDSVSHLGNEPIMMAISAYSVTLGAWSEYLLAASVAVFGLATVICWAHYGSECVRFLFPKRHKLFSFIYLIIYACVTVWGSVAAPDAVWSSADLSIGALTLINVAMLMLQRKEIVYHTDIFMRIK